MADALDLDALEATAKAATPGPYEKGNGLAGVPFVNGAVENVASIVTDDETADFIAAFDPPTVLALIARLRAAEERADNAEGQGP